VYRIIIKVLFIEVLVEQVKEQRNLYCSLKHLKKMLLKKSVLEAMSEGEKKHKKGGLNYVFKNFSFLRYENCSQGQSLIKFRDFEGEKNHKKGGLNCVFGNFFFYVLDNCPQVQSLK